MLKRSRLWLDSPLGVAVLANRYEQESGEKWTPEKQKELFELMNKEQNFDALKVEEKFFAPVRDRKKVAAEIEEKAKKRADEIVKDRGYGMPGDGTERFIPGTSRWRCKGSFAESVG